MGRLTLVLGGARSGKSTFAQELAIQRGGRVMYIATAQALDDEMTARIIAHREDRPEAWETRELPVRVGAALRQDPVQVDTVILDCLTLLVTNLLMAAAPDLDAPDEARATASVDGEVKELLEQVQLRPADWIIVSNEVGLGLVPPYPLGRVYRDLLGRANRRLAVSAHEVFFLVAGIPVPIHQFRG